MRMIYRVPAGNIDAIRDFVNEQYTGRSQNVPAYPNKFESANKEPAYVETAIIFRALITARHVPSTTCDQLHDEEAHF